MSAATSTVMDGRDECPDGPPNVELCSFCRAQCAVVRVPLPSLKKRHKRIPTAYCLLHYYTTSAVRVLGRSSSATNVSASLGSKPAAAAAAAAASELKKASRNSEATTTTTLADNKVTVINHKALEEQLPGQQELFAEAFVQLRQELQEIAMKQFTAHGHDPLAILHDLHHRHASTTTTAAAAASKKRSGRKDPPLNPQQKRHKIMDQSGGFLHRPAPLPERLQKLQQSTRAPPPNRRPPPLQHQRHDPTQRRKVSRKSVWNVLLEGDDPGSNKKTTTTTKTKNTNYDWTPGQDKLCTSCGSGEVQTISSNASQRNQDMAKAETWGNKDRGGEIITRYQCRACGKMWNEEE